MTQTAETVELDQKTSLPAQHGAWTLPVPIAMTFDELLYHDDTVDETADDIIHAVRKWRDTLNGRLD